MRRACWEPGFVWAGMVLLLFVMEGSGAPLRIDKIERFQGRYVLIHFETQPDRTYILQAINRLSCATNATTGCSRFNVPTNQWSNIYTAYALPFLLHYVVQDEQTTRQRYYRLKLMP